MRVFVAIEISDEMREQLENFKKNFSKFSETTKKIKWIKPDNFHLTLKFFGEIEEERLPLLKTSLSKSITNQNPFMLDVKGVGCFPDLRRPRVLWAGIQQGSDTLKTLAEAVEKSSVSAGFPPSDKPFSAHLTIARFQMPPEQAFLEKIKQYESFSFGRIAVNKMNLIQSKLSPAGPHYTVLEEFLFPEN